MPRLLLWLLIVWWVIGVYGCSSRKSDEERILEEIDSAAVHLTVGLKVLATNPENDPDVDGARKTLRGILEAVEARLETSQESQALTAEEIGRLAKVAFSAKRMGEVEVARGRESDFRFLVHLLALENENPDDVEITVEQDHALTLAGLFAFKLHPAAPVLISDKLLLYEAWMAGDAQFGNDAADMMIRSLQATIFARNGYCDVASQHTESIRGMPLAVIDMNEVKRSMSALVGVGRAVAHAPEAGVFLIPIAVLPAAMEVLPGGVRIMAHVETAGCFEERGNDELAMQQRQHAIDAVVAMGAPESDISLMRAALAYKHGDLESAAGYLRTSQQSELLDERTKNDLKALADHIDRPDKSLVQRYFSSAAMALAVGKIVNQRLKDQGFYDKLNEIEGVSSTKKVFSVLMAGNMKDAVSDALEDAKDTGKGLFGKLKQLIE